MDRVHAFTISTLEGEEGMCVERVQWGGLARACRWRPARGGWCEGRVVDGRTLLLDWRGGEDRVRRTCARAYAGRDVAGCWLLLDWMEGAWSREE